MEMGEFYAVGENIHCTRVFKSGGVRTKKLEAGGEGVIFNHNGSDKIMPVPTNWAEISPAYTEGKIRHIALAIHHALEGNSDEQQLGLDYLGWAAERQIESGAAFLDVNVDEYTNDNEKRCEIMKWLAAFLSKRYQTPLSIDSSNIKVLATGLECCSTDAIPMVNSVSLEREEAAEIIMQYKAHAIVSAAAKEGLPTTTEGRMTNFAKIIEKLDKLGMERSKMHLDALVFPISTDPLNGKNFLEASQKAKETFTGINLNGGLSNISFGMPNRKLLNIVFASMFIEIGGNGGIIDPVQINQKIITALEPEAEAFKLAKAVLDGSDMFGAEYIGAFREGKLN